MKRRGFFIVYVTAFTMLALAITAVLADRIALGVKFADVSLVGWQRVALARKGLKMAEDWLIGLAAAGRPPAEKTVLSDGGEDSGIDELLNGTDGVLYVAASHYPVGHYSSGAMIPRIENIALPDGSKRLCFFIRCEIPANDRKLRMIEEELLEISMSPHGTVTGTRRLFYRSKSAKM
ncbi:MAG: hypothetical protein LBT08_01790 [Synergistaceae bacterium]|jgi:hypothetical protein|nr:hypothetical protein [Synergistaceae bacterium]